MDKPMTFIEWCAGKGVIPYSLGIEAAYEAGQQSMQAKVEELQTQLSLQRQRVKAFEEELTSSRNYGDELQKRVDAAIKCADLNFWNANTVKAMVEALKGER
ncbi:hypothetical protein [Acinetobacter baumannii]|uniref:hypothetical protein n=1 Tax=Acinetobacter baumannii TaxID=470 RepID=UPI0022EB4D65|nr:hypothetical protein [Acinetobacter baumannii]MCE6122982.1 hypothetical protein [Acinetobacter baumannii]MCE6141603.1 hypothetical protein [Acinetobacter baumannii]MDA3524798.1 hypothetical protein [Acinetobacter baumannii]MDK6140302.1 hypothetical protein [Acinetobacter baumannii]